MPSAPVATPASTPPAYAAPPAPPLTLVPDPAPTAPAAAAEPLGRLPAEWAVVEDVAVEHGVVDLVIIGPNGVFAVHVDADLRPAAVRPGHGLYRAGTRAPDPVKRALANTASLNRRLASQSGRPFAYPVLLTATTGEAGHRLGRLLVVRPGRLAEALWRHVSRPLTRSQRAAVRAMLRSG